MNKKDKASIQYINRVNQMSSSKNFDFENFLGHNTGGRKSIHSLTLYFSLNYQTNI